MSYLRKIPVGIACTLLPVLLFGFGLAFSLHQVLGTPVSIKHALSESGIYDTVASNLLTQAQKKVDQQPGNSQDSIPLGQPEVKSAIQKAFPGSSIQPQVERAIDSTYSWIKGDTGRLDLSVDIGQNKQDLLANLITYANKRAAALPTCQPGSPLPTELNVLTADCRPSFISPDQAASLTKQKIEQSDLLGETSFNTTNLKDSNGQTLGERLHNIPVIYRRVVQAIYISGGLAILCLLIIVFVSQPKREGVRRAAKISLVSGIIAIVLASLSVFVTGKAGEMLAESAGNTASFQASIIDIVHILASDVRAWWLGYGIVLVILSLGAYGGLRVLREKETIEHDNAMPEEKRPHVVIN